MSQHYSNQKNASNPYRLPDVEVFEVAKTGTPWETEDGERLEPGWYWWTCLPGCMPDSEPDGPYTTEDEAIAASRDDDAEDEDDPTCKRCGEPITEDTNDDVCDDCRQAEEDSEPTEGDYTTTDHRSFYEHGIGRLRFVVVEDETDKRYRLVCPETKSAHGIIRPNLEQCIEAYLSATQFWPNVWWISDHGNAHLMTLRHEGK
jgi:hypothetical protein